MWDLPGPGLKPVSPALAGGFLTTAAPGKPPSGEFLNILNFLIFFPFEIEYIFFIIDLKCFCSFFYESFPKHS